MGFYQKLKMLNEIWRCLRLKKAGKFAQQITPTPIDKNTKGEIIKSNWLADVKLL
jgi:hypothetical protein